MSRYQPIMPKINNPEIKLPDQLVEDFMLALKSANVAEVENIIRTTNIRSNLRDYIGKDPSRKTPYHIILELDDNIADLDKKFALIKLLDKIGSPVDLPDNNNIWPIHLAAKTNDDRIISFFLEKKVDLNRADANGNTPLQYALFGKEIACPSDTLPKPIIDIRPENKKFNQPIIELIKSITKKIMNDFKETAIIDMAKVLSSIVENNSMKKKYVDMVQTQIVNLLTDPRLKDSFKDQQNKIENIMNTVFADLRINTTSKSTTALDHIVKNNNYIFELSNTDIGKYENIIALQRSELTNIKKKINSIVTDATDKEFYRVDDMTKFINTQKQKLNEILKMSITKDPVNKYLFAKYFVFLSTYYYLKFPIEVYTDIMLTGTKVMTSEEFDGFILQDFRYQNGVPQADQNKSIFSMNSIDIVPDIYNLGYHTDLLRLPGRQREIDLYKKLSINGGNPYTSRLLTSDIFFYDIPLLNIGKQLPMLSKEITQIMSSMQNQNSTFGDIINYLKNNILNLKNNPDFVAEPPLTFLRNDISKSYLSIIFLLHRMISASINGRITRVVPYPKILGLNISAMYDEIDKIYDKSNFMGLQSTKNYQLSILMMKITIKYLETQIRQIYQEFFRKKFNAYNSLKGNPRVDLDNIYHLYNDTAYEVKLDFALSTSILFDGNIDNNVYEGLPEYKNLLNEISPENPLQKFIAGLKSTPIVKKIFSNINEVEARYFMNKYTKDNVLTQQARKYDEINKFIDKIIKDLTEAEIDEIYTNNKSSDLFAHIDSLQGQFIKISDKFTIDEQQYTRTNSALQPVDQNRSTLKGLVTYQNTLSTIQYINSLTNLINKHITSLTQITLDTDAHINKRYDYHILQHMIPAFTIYNIRLVKKLHEQFNSYGIIRKYNDDLGINNGIVTITKEFDNYSIEFSLKLINMSNIFLSKVVTYLNLSSSYNFLHQLGYRINPIDSISNIFNQYIDKIKLPIFDITDNIKLSDQINVFRSECQINNYNYYMSAVTYNQFNADAAVIYNRSIYTDIKINLMQNTLVNGEVFDQNLDRSVGSIGIIVGNFDRNPSNNVFSSIYDSIDYRLLLSKTYIISDIISDITMYDTELNKLFATDTQQLKDLNYNKKALIGKLTDNIITEIITNLLIRTIGEMIKQIIRESNPTKYGEYLEIFSRESIYKFKLTDIVNSYADIPNSTKKYIHGYSTVNTNPNKLLSSNKINEQFIQYLYDTDFSSDITNSSNRKKCIYIDHNIITKLMTQINVAKLDSNGNNILHYLVMTHNNELIKNIIGGTSRIEPKYLLTGKNIRGQTPLNLAIDNLQNHISFISGSNFIDRYDVLVNPFVSTMLKRLNNERFGGNILKNTELVIPFVNLMYHHMYWNYLQSFNYGTNLKQKQLIKSDDSYDFYGELYDESAISSVLSDYIPKNIRIDDTNEINKKKIEEINNKISILNNMVNQLTLGKSAETDPSLIAMYDILIDKHNADLFKLSTEKQQLAPPKTQQIRQQFFEKKLEKIIGDIRSDVNAKYDLIKIYEEIFKQYSKSNNNIVNGDVARSAINNSKFTSSIDITIKKLSTLSSVKKEDVVILSEYLETIVNRINLKYDLPQTLSENVVLKEEYEMIAFALNKLISGIIYEYLMQAFYKSLESQTIEIEQNINEIFEDLATTKINNMTIREYINYLSKMYIRYTTHIYDSNSDPLQTTTTESDIYNGIVDYFKLNKQINLIETSPFITDLRNVHLPFIGETYRNIINSTMASIYANEKYLIGLSVYVKDYVALL